MVFDDADGARAEQRSVVILGGGPAGLTAAIYAARANLEPLGDEAVEGLRLRQALDSAREWPVCGHWAPAQYGRFARVA